MQNTPLEALYHLAEGEIWEQQQTAVLYQPTDFEREGFVHCSTAAQLPGTAARFYAGRKDMYLLTLDPQALPVVYENLEGGEMLFPHVYQPLPKAAVQAAQKIHIDDQGVILKLS
jgi:uncharacterized protein (DUF952 family)